MDGSNLDAVTGAELRAFVERIEHLRAEQSEIKAQEAEVFAELKARGYMSGYMKRPVRTIIKERAMKPDELAEEQAILEMYRSALGMA
jgi:uncharacterized protein (UPF0335 family)